MIFPQLQALFLKYSGFSPIFLHDLPVFPCLYSPAPGPTAGVSWGFMAPGSPGPAGCASVGAVWDGCVSAGFVSAGCVSAGAV